jgi:hypothetical protein
MDYYHFNFSKKNKKNFESLLKNANDSDCGSVVLTHPGKVLRFIT